MEQKTKVGRLDGLRVLSLESRRSAEMAKLIANYGGEAIVAPSMREVPLESNLEALAFARMLLADGVDIVIFLTGVGVRALVRVVKTLYPVEQFAAALHKVPIIARGPKPVAALKDLGVAVTLAVPEPSTWRDLLRVLDDRADTLPIKGLRIAVQEYGTSNLELLEALTQRGAEVIPVPVYQWALPEDTRPLRIAIDAITCGQVDIALFTTSQQITHLLEVAREMKVEDPLREAFTQIVVGSIGPITSGELRKQGLIVDFEPAHPKMGFLVNEAARCGAERVSHKRDSGAGNLAMAGPPGGGF